VFQSDELAWMQENQNDRMPSICYRLIYIPSRDEAYQEIATYTQSLEEIPCGLDLKPGDERNTDRQVILRWDATIRLPISTRDLWDVRDQILVTHHFVELLEPLRFEIVGPPQFGPSALRFRLNKVVADVEEIGYSY